MFHALVNVHCQKALQKKPEPFSPKINYVCVSVWEDILDLVGRSKRRRADDELCMDRVRKRSI